MGMIFDILRFSLNDGPGIRTSVFLKGCPLNCRWCHNPESKNPLPQTYLDGSKTIGREMDAQEIVQLALKDLAYYKASGGGLTITGGEPLFQPAFALELLVLAKRHGLHTVVETSGYAKPSDIERIMPYTDLFLYDYKGDGKIHKRLTGVESALIIRNLEYLYAHGAGIVIRCPVVPGVNDDAQAREQFLSRFPGVAHELLPYHNMGEGKAEALGLEYWGDTPL